MKTNVNSSRFNDSAIQRITQRQLTSEIFFLATLLSPSG